MILILILLVISSFFLAWLLYWCYQVLRYEWYLRGIPGPFPVPFFGNSLALSNSTTVLFQLMEYYKKYKGNFRIYLGSQPYLYVCESKDLEFLLTSSIILTKTDRHKYMENWLGKGLLNSDGELWKERRKIISPAFHFRILEEFIEVFNLRSDILITKLMSQCDKGCFDIYPFIARCSLDIICETAMGTTVNAQDDLESEYVKCNTVIGTIATQRFHSPIQANDFLYSFTPTHQKEADALKKVHGFTTSVIEMRKSEFFGTVKKLEAIDYLGIKKRRAFLDLLLEYASKHPNLSEEGIREEVDTFMVAGYATVASAVAFTLHQIAANPDIQENIYAELQTIFVDNMKRSPKRKDLQEMTYLETVIMEALRMYPVVPIYGRSLDHKMRFNGRMLPKGLMLNIFAYGLQNSPFHFENPDEFNPDRFAADNFEKMDPFNYLPFSTGLRSCAGRKFALLEIKALLSSILRNFELLAAVPEHKMVFEGTSLLRSQNGVVLQLKKRE